MFGSPAATAIRLDIGMNELSALIESPIFTWITSGAIVTIASILTTSFWERRKLNRTERSKAYASFLSAFSQRWRAFGDRDGARKREDAEAEAEADSRVKVLRDVLYAEYAHIQVLASQPVVEAAFRLVTLSDARQRSFATEGQTPGVGADTRSAALAAFVAVARKELGLAGIDVDALRDLQRLKRR